MGHIAFFKENPDVTAFFTTRQGGVSPEPFTSLNLGPFTKDAPEHIRENRKRALETAGIGGCRSAGLQQVHGNRVRRVTAGTLRETAPGEHLHMGEGDALITNQKNVVLTTLHADCPGILLYDPKNRAIGAVHAGWRGTLAEIGPAAIRAMKEAYGTEPQNLMAALTPCISFCCFETGPEVFEAFREKFSYIMEYARQAENGKYFLDLQGLNERQLENCGVIHIEKSPFCTVCEEELFFSYRRDGGKTGRMMAAICIRK